MIAPASAGATVVPLPRTGRRLAQELDRLLERAGIQGPYILVGHSLGGFITRLYREEHPRDVVGMVLVDAGHESEMRQAEFRAFTNAGKSMLPVIRAMTMLGIPRLMASSDQLPPLLTGQEEKVPAEIRPMLRAGWLRTGYFSTLTDESDALIDTLEQVRHTRSLDDLPLVVITATGPLWWPDMPGQVNPAKFKKMWLDLQQNLTTLSSTVARCLPTRAVISFNSISRRSSARPFARWSLPPAWHHVPNRHEPIHARGEGCLRRDGYRRTGS
jgi:pimeloyl-ACP methyl ester carboxylesterase